MEGRGEGGGEGGEREEGGEGRGEGGKVKTVQMEVRRRGGE